MLGVHLRRDPVRVLSALFVLYCGVLHFIEGLLVYIYPQTVLSTAVFMPILLFGSHQMAGLMFLTAGFLAFASLWARFPAGLFMLLPQQALLLVCASGVISAVVMEQFASGPHFPWYQILAEQLNVILVSIFHASAIVMRAVLMVPRHEI